MKLNHMDREGNDPLKVRLAREARIFFNGKEAAMVIWADDEAGTLERYQSEGERAASVARGDFSVDWPTVIETGDVEIRDPAGVYVKGVK